MPNRKSGRSRKHARDLSRVRAQVRNQNQVQVRTLPHRDSALPIPQIRFKHRALADLRAAVLTEDGRESFATLLARRQTVGRETIFTVRDVRLAHSDDYMARDRAFLRLDKAYNYQVLAELQQRMDVDTLIDVHTHPFATRSVAFSGVDDRDERRFAEFLADRFENLHYASIVLSQQAYQARVWNMTDQHVQPQRACLGTQTCGEQIIESGRTEGLGGSAEARLLTAQDAIFSRSALALGLEVMRHITSGQTIAVAGVGGIGSIMAEHLVHCGFGSIILIDPDHLECSNMNRFAGATMQQARRGDRKVDVVQKYLQSINPDVTAIACPHPVSHPQARELMARSDWIMLATDNHASRRDVQQLAMQCFVPLITAGTNITVADGSIQDMSGEIITVRAGDRRCLNCLGRINLARLTVESHPDAAIRAMTVQRGYVEGLDVKEPAVKTLNAMLASLAVERLLDQYQPNRRDVPILVYENTPVRAIYEDRVTLENRNPGGCSVCDV